MNMGRLGILAAALIVSGAWGQETKPLPPGTPTETVSPTLPPAATPPADAVPGPTAVPVPAAVPAPDAAAPAVPVKPAVVAKKGKEVYTGPTAIVSLEPTPMLDEEGRQRLDPDGKPMFNPPIHQQRDRKGHPLFDGKGQPVYQSKDELGYDENGKKLKEMKEKEPKTVSLEIVHGTLTVDGMTGKAGLNYDIKDLKYIYLYAPWVGMTIVSADPFPGAIEQKDAWKMNTLTVMVGEHTYELYSDKMMLGKKPQSAYVVVDRDFSMATRFPVVGYGNQRKPPYAFPGVKVTVAAKGSTAPPLPESLRPATALPPCPAGQMRPAGAVALDGQAAPACVPIRK